MLPISRSAEGLQVRTDVLDKNEIRRTTSGINRIAVEERLELSFELRVLEADSRGAEEILFCYCGLRLLCNWDALQIHNNPTVEGTPWMTVLHVLTDGRALTVVVWHHRMGRIVTLSGCVGLHNQRFLSPQRIWSLGSNL